MLKKCNSHPLLYENKSYIILFILKLSNFCVFIKCEDYYFILQSFLRHFFYILTWLNNETKFVHLVARHPVYWSQIKTHEYPNSARTEHSLPLPLTRPAASLTRLIIVWWILSAFF